MMVTRQTRTLRSKTLRGAEVEIVDFEAFIQCLYHRLSSFLDLNPPGLLHSTSVYIGFFANLNHITPSL